MQTWILSLLILILPWNETKTPHALYLGVVELHLGETKREVVVKVFTNDLEDAIHNFTHREIALIGHYPDREQEVLTGYFQHHLQCSQNGQTSKLIWKGYQTEGDASWLRFELSSTAQIGNLSLRADFLMELFPTQINVLKVTRNGEDHPLAMVKLTKSSPQYELQLN